MLFSKYDVIYLSFLITFLRRQPVTIATDIN